MKASPAAPTHFRMENHRLARHGMTLLEITVVVVVIMALVNLLFIGSISWKRGADRTMCIMNMNNVQKGIRGFSNIYGFEPGSNVPGLKNKIIGTGRFVETIPTCPSGGLYTYGLTDGVDTIPTAGTVYLECSLEGSHEHTPPNPAEW